MKNQIEKVEWTDDMDAALHDYEESIREHRDSFDAVVSALIGIKTEKLYLKCHSTFAEYCEKVWKFGVRWAQQLIAGEESIREIEAASHNSHDLKPVNTEVLRKASGTAKSELAKSSNKNLSKVASKSLEISNGKPPTSKQVKIARAQVEHLVRPPRKEVPLVNFYVDPKPKTEPEAYDVEPEGAVPVPDEENLPFNWQWEAQKRVQKVYEANKVKWNSPPPPAPSAIIESILAELRKS